MMALFTRAVSSGCGSATSQTGPFYCFADQKVYINLLFFEQIEEQLGAGGDFAYAYVIAHEVGHHVQYLLGTLTDVSQAQRRLSKKESNRLNVRLELQADFYAGIWAYHNNKMYNSLEEGDIEEGLNAAAAIGNDRLQMLLQGYTVPDAFNHGTSAQRTRWLKKGATADRVSDGDTFSQNYVAL
ncbi:MAG: neutral zinc metallopeptidase [Cytophagaceae bacterium]|nr:neutral zinc metallopeptidase [Cytophagaceae bacterium]